MVHEPLSFEDANESILGAGDERDHIVGFEVGIDLINLADLGVQSATATTSALGAGCTLSVLVEIQILKLLLQQQRNTFI